MMKTVRDFAIFIIGITVLVCAELWFYHYQQDRSEVVKMELRELNPTDGGVGI